MKKKIITIMSMLLLAIALISGGIKSYAAEVTKLKLENEVLSTIEMVAGGTLHYSVELSLKESFCFDPIFSITPKDGAPLSFTNLKVTNKDSNNGEFIYIDDKSHVVLNYDINVDDFAQIGVYEYAITFTPSKDWLDEEQEILDPGELILRVSVVAEKTPPQISIVSGSELSCKAGDVVTMKFTIENEGELQAMNTYVYANYAAYDDVLTPMYTPLTQKLGNLYSGQKKEVEISYKIAEDAKTQRVMLPIEITYKMANGESGNSNGSYVYLYVEGKPAPTATPTPTPTATPTPTPTPAPETDLLLLNTVKQSPKEPKAGETVNVSFYLENAGTANVKNVKVSAVGLSSAGFEPVNSEPYQYIGTIEKGKKKQVELNLKVGENIPEGLNTLDIQYSYDVETAYGLTTKTENVTLYILNVKNPEESELTISRPKLMVSNFYTDVEEVKAGSVFDFTFEIMNTNDSIDAKNIKVTVTGASNAFSVTAGGNSFFVNSIKAQEKAPITINLKASAATTTGAYPIQIKIEYEYEGMVATATYSGEVVEEEILLQVKENLRPSVENVYVGSWETPMVYQPTTMSFEFYNMGKSTLNNTYVTMEGDFMLSNGSNSFYIGNIIAGMPEYIEFDVVPLVEGDAIGKMIIHMEDSNGDEVTMEKEFTAYIMGETMWEDPGYMDPGYMDPGYMDPSMPVDGEPAEKPILPLWMFLCIQGAILVIVIPVTRAIRLAAYRRKIKREDAI